MNMMKKVTGALVLVFALVSGAMAQINKVIIGVDGLACPFCAYGLQKQLKRVPGIKGVKIYVDRGRAELTVAEGESVDFSAIEDAVKKGGYTPRDIWVEATGRVEQWNGRPALVIPENDVKFLLAENDHLRKLNDALSSRKDRSVFIAGKLDKQDSRGHHGHPYTLIIERFELVD
ncbi:MAG: copper chaperone [Acidobacteria bacterium]|nr:MAG: copper chaperone [Acidobacteriota bacterium]